jgi:predicted phosphoribosyltransferase
MSTLGDPSALVPHELRFCDRPEAGRRLAALLEHRRDERPVVLGIPRGGVPVAAEVARALDAPLDVVVVRKLGAPHNPEYAIGALAEGGVRVLCEDAARAAGLSEDRLDELAARAERELLQGLALYRGARGPISLRERTAIIVDDGLATGRSALAAVRSARERGAARAILAVPVGAPEAARMLRRHADEVVCVVEPEQLWAVGCWYGDFGPTTDAEAVAALAGSSAAEACVPRGQARLGSSAAREASR